MPRTSKPRARRAPARRAKKASAPSRSVKKSGNTPEYASASVKTTLLPADGTMFKANTLYNKINTQLSDFPRAVLLGQAYQHYRMSKISITFKPTLDSFVPNQVPSATYSKPYLFYMIDKSGAINTNTTLEALKNMGARPKALDEKPIVVSWSPSILTADATATTAGLAYSAAQYKISPWLSTQATPGQPGAFVASSVDHFGLYWYVDSVLGGQSITYQVDIEVQFQFKKPLLHMIPSSTPAVPAVVGVIDNSSDGIADGRDRGLPANF